MTSARTRRPYTPRLPADQRRDQLLDAALQIIAADGYGAVSIEAIARAVDVTRPVIYNVFAGLDDLLFALLDRQERRALDQLATTVTFPSDFGDIEGFLRTAITDLIAMVHADPVTWRLVFLASAGSPVAVRERVDRDREIVRTRLRTGVALAGTTGLLPSGLDADIVAHALIALGEYFGRLLLDSPAEVDADRLTATVLALVKH